MSKLARRVISILDRFYHRCLDYGVGGGGVLIALLMLVTSAHVAGRRFFLTPIKWSTEMSEYAMVFITFLGAAWVLKHEGHIVIDIVPNALKPKPRAWLNVVISCLMAAICLLITVVGGITTYDAIVRNANRVYLYTTPLWILIIIIPISYFLLFIQSVRRAIQNLQSTKRNNS